MKQSATGIGLVFLIIAGLSFLSWICFKVHESLGQREKKIWEKICWVVVILIIIGLAMLGYGGGNMENIWRARR